MYLASNSTESRPLPLQVDTPFEWASHVLEDPLALLNDHGHLEKKAAANALTLLQRWPDYFPSERWVREVSSIAKDETQHLSLVVKILHERGASLSKSHRNSYAQDLHTQVRRGSAQQELLDRLMVSALIEARSCERFYLLSQETQDDQLRRLYHGLWSSEHDHFEVFLQLAKDILPEDEVNSRWEWFLQQEAEVIQSQKAGARIHSWFITG